MELTQWLPGGKVLAFSPAEKGYRLWDGRSGKQLAKVSTGNKDMWGAVVSPDGKFLAIAYYRPHIDGNNDDLPPEARPPWSNLVEYSQVYNDMHLYDLQTGKEIRKFGPMPGRTQPITFTSDGRFLIARHTRYSGGVGSLAFWDTATGKVTDSLNLLNKEVKGDVGGAAVSADGKSIVLGMFGTNSLCCVDLVTGKQRWCTDAGMKESAGDLPDDVNRARAALGLGMERLGGKERPSRWRSPPTARWSRAVCQERSSCEMVKRARCCARLDTSSKDRKPGHRQAGALAFTPDGKKLIAADDRTNVFVWDVATGKELHKFAGHRGRIFSISVSPDNTLFATASEDSTVLVWRLE